MTGQFIAGALIAGAGVAAATDSWDSFAGGLTGGIAGAAVGTGFVNTEQFKNWKAGEGFVSNRTAAVNQARAERALNVNVAEDPVTVKTYWRGLEGKNGKPSGPRVHPFMEDWKGNYHELDVNKGKISILEGDITKMSRATQAYMATGPKPDEVTKVYGSEFFKAISQYKADRVGDPYHILKPTLDPIADNCIGFKEYVIDSSRVQ